ncbi:hypothetical protein ASG66_01255 [Bacillus sp. Leaf406]|nr:hypothetical protein ASG66_01255 [Bacillus sp. Leaf406]
MRPRRLAEEAHGLPAESEGLHGNHKRNKELIRIVFVIKWCQVCFAPQKNGTVIINRKFFGAFVV